MVRLPDLHLLFGCESLHLFPLVVEWILSDDSYVLVYKHNRVPLIVLGIGSCPWGGSQFRAVIGWPSPHLCSIFVSAHLIGRTHFILKVLWTGGYPYVSTGNQAWLQEVSNLGSKSPNTSAPS